MLSQFFTFNRKTKAKWLLYLTHVAAWIPLAILFFDFWSSNLGPEPIREITLRTGEWALILLIGSLAITPLKILFGWKQLFPLRKWLGLYAFMYVTLHLLIFVGLDYGFAWGFIIEEITRRYYAIVGFVAFLILLPLAATSSKWAMRKLGKKWRTLHRLVYLAGMLGVLHFALTLKNPFGEPVIYGVVLGLLLLVRVPRVKKYFTQLQQRRKTKSATSGQKLKAS